MSHVDDTRVILARSEPFHSTEYVELLEQRRLSVAWAMDTMPTPKLCEARILTGGSGSDPLGRLAERYTFTGNSPYSLKMKGLFGPLRREIDAGGHARRIAWGLTRTDFDWVLITTGAGEVRVERVGAQQLVEVCGDSPLLVWFALEEIVREWSKRLQEKAKRAERLATRLAVENEFYLTQPQAFSARQFGPLLERLSRIESLARSCGHPHVSRSELDACYPLLVTELEKLVSDPLSIQERVLVHSRFVSRILNVQDCRWHNVHDLVSDTLMRIVAKQTDRALL